LLLLLYKLLTWSILLLIVPILPLLDRVRPKFAKWFRLRFWPEPVHFTPSLWVHAVSVGEINIALALLGGAERVSKRVLITTSTRSGFAFLTDKLGRQRVRYLPWDLTYCYKQLFHGVKQPDLVVVETEIWPHLFRFASSQGARLMIVNGRLSKKTLRFRKLPLLTQTLNRASVVAVRGSLDRERFLSLGMDPQKVRVTGNIKYDFQPRKLNSGPLQDWLELNKGMLLFASISADEITLLLPAVSALSAAFPDRGILWAPRHLETLPVHLEALAALNPVLRSELDDQSTPPQVVVLDSFGELSGCYAYAGLSLIGGSFNQRGGQNFLESLQAGAPAVMGPSTHNFSREVEEAREAGAILTLNGPDEVEATLDALLRNPDSLAEMSIRARAFLQRGTGAIDRTRSLLLELGVPIDLESPENT